jgi:hypothetical protein
MKKQEEEEEKRKELEGFKVQGTDSWTQHFEMCCEGGRASKLRRSVGRYYVL